MSAFNRRAAIKGAFASVAAPALVSGCTMPPAFAAAYVAAPVSPTLATSSHADTKLFELCAEFERLDAEEHAIFERYCSLPEKSEEAKAISASFDRRYAIWAAASDACYATTPQTPAGAAVLLDLILTRDSEHIDEAIQKPLRLIRDGLKAMVLA